MGCCLSCSNCCCCCCKVRCRCCCCCKVPRCSCCNCCSKGPRFSCAWLMCCFFPKAKPKLTTSDSGKVYPGVQFFPRNVHRITSMQSWEAKLSQANKDGKTVVANFSASWSHPCRDIMPTYFELANKYSFLVFLTVDADELAELCTSWNINATPTFYFLKDGRQLDKFVGADKLELKKKVAAVADSATKAHN